MPEIKVKTEYIEKLKALGVYDKWLSNLKAQWNVKDNCSGNSDIKPESFYAYNWGNLVSWAFTWDLTPEKFDFWSNISRR